MRKWLTVLACSTVLAAGPCTLDSWNVAIAPGIGGDASFIGVDLDFGELDLVLPLVPFEN